jgi:hypothetical protein
LPELRTIHPKKIPRPTQPIRDFFVFIVTPPSCLNKFTALTVHGAHRTETDLGWSFVNGLEERPGSREECSRP